MRRIAFLLIVSLAACAPEPTDPASTSLAGVWISSAHVFALSNIRMALIQEPNGIVSGTWAARRDAAACGKPAACEVTGDLIGRNTVSQVEIQILGAGRFEGGLVETNRMRGIFAVQDVYDTITFVRSTVPPNANRLPVQ